MVTEESGLVTVVLYKAWITDEAESGLSLPLVDGTSR